MKKPYIKPVLVKVGKKIATLAAGHPITKR
jgi:hypothetical protein